MLFSVGSKQIQRKQETKALISNGFNFAGQFRVIVARNIGSVESWG